MKKFIFDIDGTLTLSRQQIDTSFFWDNSKASISEFASIIVLTSIVRFE